MGECAPLGAKSPPHESRRLDPIPPALERRIQPGQEIVQVRGDDAHAFLQGDGPAGRDERECDHGPGEVLDGNLDDDKGYAFATIVGRVGVS